MMWQVAMIMDYLQCENWEAARDATALLAVCLEQTALDSSMDMGLLLSLTEDPPSGLFTNRSFVKRKSVCPTGRPKMDHNIQYPSASSRSWALSLNGETMWEDRQQLRRIPARPQSRKRRSNQSLEPGKRRGRKHWRINKRRCES